MTREEAAKILKELWGVDYHYYLKEKEAEAVDMAIVTLETDITFRGYNFNELMLLVDLLQDEGINSDGLHHLCDDYKVINDRIKACYDELIKESIIKMIEGLKGENDGESHN